MFPVPALLTVSMSIIIAIIHCWSLKFIGKNRYVLVLKHVYSVSLWILPVSFRYPKIKDTEVENLKLCRIYFVMDNNAGRI